MGNKQAFVNAMIGYANDNTHGYSQSNRWGPDYDCSSLIYQCAYDAGYDVPTSGERYTGTMKGHFCAAGFSAYAPGSISLEAGDICLNEVHHVEMYIGNGQLCGAHGNYDNVQGDSSGGEISAGAYYDYPWDVILRPPADGGSTGDGGSIGTSIAEDGYWGTETMAAFQRHYGTVVDGEVWHQWAPNIQANPVLTTGWVCDETLLGSPVIRAIQGDLGVTADGIMGPDTIAAIYSLFGGAYGSSTTLSTGVVWEIQHQLNGGVWPLRL